MQLGIIIIMQLRKIVFYKDSSKYEKLVFENLTHAKGLVPESVKLQFILKSWFQRLKRIPLSKHNSFTHETCYKINPF